MTAGKLTVGSNGRITGPAKIEYNSPFPTANGRWGSGAMMGVLMHTMVGNLPGTISWFNNPTSQASAHFGIAQGGLIHQFGPIGKGWIAWHAAEANAAWYGIEHADDGDPANPLTDAQLTASAQLVECLSAFAGFPLRVSDSPSVKGYGTHSMGGAAWGGHACPGSVRAAQRAEVISRAQAIRSATAPAPPPAPAHPPWPYGPQDYLGPPSPDPHCHSGYYGGPDHHNVRTWQQRMRDRGWTITVDGYYGSQSQRVCRAFQQEKGLTVDGLTGPQTWNAAWTAPVT